MLAVLGWVTFGAKSTPALSNDPGRAMAVGGGLDLPGALRLVTETDVSCDQLLNAADVALNSLANGQAGWDSLLNAVATKARGLCCGLDTPKWFAVIAAESQDTVLRAHAELHLGLLARQSGKLNDAISHFETAAVLAATMPASRSANDIEIGAWHALSGTHTRVGNHAAAAEAGRQARSIAERTRGGSDEIGRLLTANQVRLESQAANHATAAALAVNLMAAAPRTVEEARDFALNSIRRYQLGLKAGESQEEASVALEIAWNNSMVRKSVEACRVGCVLSDARLAQKGRAAEAFDIAAEVIELIESNADSWRANADPALNGKQLETAIKSAAISCASRLQNVSQHGNLDYLNLAYSTIVRHSEAPETKDRMLDQWDRALADYAAGR